MDSPDLDTLAPQESIGASFGVNWPHEKMREDALYDARVRQIDADVARGRQDEPFVQIGTRR